MRNIDLEFLLKVLQLTATIDGTDRIWWRADGDYWPVTVFVTCNDQFEAGLADCEELTPGNIHLFEEAIKEVGDFDPSLYAPMLFCAKVRKMRPRGCMYPKDARIAECFDLCGPPRIMDSVMEVGSGAIEALRSAVHRIEEEVSSNLFVEEEPKPLSWWERLWLFIKELIEKIKKKIKK